MPRIPCTWEVKINRRLAWTQSEQHNETEGYPSGVQAGEKTMKK